MVTAAFKSLRSQPEDDGSCATSKSMMTVNRIQEYVKLELSKMKGYEGYGPTEKKSDIIKANNAGRPPHMRNTKGKKEALKQAQEDTISIWSTPTADSEDASVECSLASGSQQSDDYDKLEALLNTPANCDPKNNLNDEAKMKLLASGSRRDSRTDTRSRSLSQNETRTDTRYRSSHTPRDTGAKSRRDLTPKRGLKKSERDSSNVHMNYESSNNSTREASPYGRKSNNISRGRQVDSRLSHSSFDFETTPHTKTRLHSKKTSKYDYDEKGVSQSHCESSTCSRDAENVRHDEDDDSRVEVLREKARNPIKKLLPRSKIKKSLSGSSSTASSKHSRDSSQSKSSRSSRGSSQKSSKSTPKMETSLEDAIKILQTEAPLDLEGMEMEKKTWEAKVSELTSLIDKERSKNSKLEELEDLLSKKKIKIQEDTNQAIWQIKADELEQMLEAKKLEKAKKLKKLVTLLDDLKRERSQKQHVYAVLNGNAKKKDKENKASSRSLPSDKSFLKSLKKPNFQ